MITLSSVYDLKDWLESLRCYDVKPVTITLGKSTYFACEYKQDNIASNGKPHIVHCFYVLGNRHRPKDHIHYQWSESPYHWYEGGYAEEETVNNPQYSSYHPFGVWFSLFPWDIPGDCGCKNKNVSMNVSYLE